MNTRVALLHGHTVPVGSSGGVDHLASLGEVVVKDIELVRVMLYVVVYSRAIGSVVG